MAPLAWTFNDFHSHLPTLTMHMLYLINSSFPLSLGYWMTANSNMIQFVSHFIEWSLCTHHSLFFLFPLALSWEAITSWPHQVLHSQPLKDLVWIQLWIWRVSSYFWLHTEAAMCRFCLCRFLSSPVKAIITRSLQFDKQSDIKGRVIILKIPLKLNSSKRGANLCLNWVLHYDKLNELKLTVMMFSEMNVSLMYILPHFILLELIRRYWGYSKAFSIMSSHNISNKCVSPVTVAPFITTLPNTWRKMSHWAANYWFMIWYINIMPPYQRRSFTQVKRLQIKEENKKNCSIWSWNVKECRGKWKRTHIQVCAALLAIGQYIDLLFAIHS